MKLAGYYRWSLRDRLTFIEIYSTFHPLTSTTAFAAPSSLAW